MPPFLGVVHKALPSHGHNQQIPPTALFRRDGLRGRMRLCVGTIIAGAHVDATFRGAGADRSEEHTSELQSRSDLVCRLLLEKKKKRKIMTSSIEKKKK